MNAVINFEELTSVEVTTERAVKELEKLADTLSSMKAEGYDMFKIKTDIWFKVCQTKTDIWFKDDIEYTKAKLEELRNYVLSVRYSIA